jgi:uncharacterized protein (DUF305 family)
VTRAAEPRGPRVSGWWAVGAGAVSLAVGLLAGPAMPWADDVPSAGSAEVGFARDMQTHHEQAVHMSVLAQRNSTEPAIRALATDVVLTQTSQLGAFKGWLTSWGQPAVDRSHEAMAWMGEGHLLPDGRMPGMATTEQLRELERLTGDAFDRAYLTLLYEHHVGGLPMAQAVVDRTDVGFVEQMAASIRDSQTKELDVLADLLRAEGAPVPAGPGAHSGGHATSPSSGASAGHGGGHGG